MASSVNYAAVAAARGEGLGVRILIGVFIAGSAYALAPSPWPMLWFFTMVFFQLCDHLVATQIAEVDGPTPRLLGATYLISTFFSASAYAAITLYLWMEGGAVGRWFGLIGCCGGLLHVSLRAFSSRWILIAAGAPHAVMMFGLPVLYAWLSPRADVKLVEIVVLGAALYVAHLAAAVRQSKKAVTQLTEASEAAHEARKLAECASAAKSEFLATVSHEIRTPMNAVLSAAHLLKRTDLTPAQQEHVAMLTNAGEVLVGLLNDVLDISKIEAGKMVLDEADLNLPEALDSLMKLYAPRLDSKGVSLVLDAPADMPVMIRTDPLRMRQILFNLLSNAAKFTDDGQVTLRVGVTAGSDAEPEMLAIEVEDTGCGIDEEAQGRLFGSFEQARGDTARSHGGTGLGLAISKKLAEMMGGGLTCASVMGQGSVFRLEVPLVRVAGHSPVASIAGEDADEDELPFLSILVAEDHDVNRKIVGLFLEPLGWRLTMAVNGAEAVKAAELERFDAILMDMQMPIMGGIDASLAIREGGGANAATPIIALTANALGHHRDAWDVVGPLAFLTKPIDPNLLVNSLLAAHAAGKPARQQAPKAA